MAGRRVHRCGWTDVYRDWTFGAPQLRRSELEVRPKIAWRGAARCASMGDMDYREAGPHDIDAIANLHADSWRRHYRGAYSDAYLDGDVVPDRLAVWTERLAQPDPATFTVVAERDGMLAGFAHTIFGADAARGALLDNLHVAADLKGQRVGTRLLAATAQAVIDRAPSAGLFLYVLENNRAAQAFYDARGGTCVGRERFEPPGGGSTVGLMYVWPDASALLPSPGAEEPGVAEREDPAVGTHEPVAEPGVRGGDPHDG
jgi:ribosomal protein S18 acetylase RimI-like enzyme